MVYRPVPPYEVVSTATMPEDEIDTMKRFARYWDLIANSGNFLESTRYVCHASDSAFESFRALSEWLYVHLGRTHHLPLNVLAMAVFEHLTEVVGLDREAAALAVARDLHRTRGRKTPKLLKPHLPRGWRPAEVPKVSGGLVRQARHAAG